MRSVHAVILSLLLLSLSACALFPHRDPLNINVVGIEPLQSQDMEVRFAVKIRVQNPNETPSTTTVLPWIWKSTVSPSPLA